MVFLIFAIEKTLSSIREMEMLDCLFIHGFFVFSIPIINLESTLVRACRLALGDMLMMGIL